MVPVSELNVHLTDCGVPEVFVPLNKILALRYVVGMEAIVIVATAVPTVHTYGGVPLIVHPVGVTRLPILEPPPEGVCQVAAVELVAVGTIPVDGVPLTAIPLIFATPGFGYVPERSPPAAPVGGPPPPAIPQAPPASARESIPEERLNCVQSPFVIPDVGIQARIRSAPLAQICQLSTVVACPSSPFAAAVKEAATGSLNCVAPLASRAPVKVGEAVGAAPIEL